MSDYNIRMYKNSDYEVARELFIHGNNEHTKEVFKHAISLPHNWLFMLFVFLLTLLITGSIVLSILAGTIVLVILWLFSIHVFPPYAQRCLYDDMLDINKYYMQTDGYCFWVAESAGQVVGTVAAAPSPFPKGKNHVELKRLTVAKNHRGRGVAKALCRTAIDFARERGCEAVDLETSLPQVDACWLYEKMGFKLIDCYTPRKFKLILLDFKAMIYQYDIPK